MVTLLWILLVLPAHSQPQVSIVMDDLGFNTKAARATAAFPCALTGAIIPSTKYATECAAILMAAGKEIFIHMPMTAKRDQGDTDYFLIRPRLSCTEVGRLIQEAQKILPHAVGMNNHEGGFATTNRTLMDCVMSHLPKGFLFLDSSTTPKTRAWMAARDAGVPWSRCNQFLLGDTPEDLAISFQDILKKAKRRGQMVMIAHPSMMALDELPKLIKKAKRQGFQFVPVTETRRGG